MLASASPSGAWVTRCRTVQDGAFCRGRALCRSHIRRSGGLHGVPNDVTERRPARFLAAAQNGTSGALVDGKHAQR